jgi:tellurite resistance protein
MSYAYVREGKSRKDLDAMVANAAAQAEADQKLTNEQREKAIATFRALGAKLQPLPQNTELVEKMIGYEDPIKVSFSRKRESSNPCL